MISMLGYGQPAVQFVAQVDRIRLVGDGVSYVGSGKTVTDHVLSNATGTDCRVFNALSGNPICASETANEATRTTIGIGAGAALAE